MERVQDRGQLIVEKRDSLLDQFAPRRFPLRAELRSFSSKAFVYRG